jgi:hypothetical protein
MASAKKIMEGIAIQLKYCGEDDNCSASHDEIYGPCDEDNLDKNDIEALESLGWFWNSEFECWMINT